MRGSAAFPLRCVWPATVAKKQNRVPGYSGGTATDSHRVPLPGVRVHVYIY
jgi:hypothetical protein